MLKIKSGLLNKFSASYKIKVQKTLICEIYLLKKTCFNNKKGYMTILVICVILILYMMIGAIQLEGK